MASDGYLDAAECRGTQGSDADAVQNGAEDAIVVVEPQQWWSESLAEDSFMHESVA